VWQKAKQVYEQAIAAGIAPEVARAVLPEGMTPTSFFAAATLRSWIHYFEARLDEHAQKEHRDMAEAMLRVICNWCEMLKDVVIPQGFIYVENLLSVEEVRKWEGT
jgi:thymidylate synthase (FAD)